VHHLAAPLGCVEQFMRCLVAHFVGHVMEQVLSAEQGECSVWEASNT
jgi:hypothetical protein